MRPSDVLLNLIEIYDVVDLVVEGSNLTADIAHESVFGLLSQLLEELNLLLGGQKTKTIIEFHCEPWELVLVFRGDRLGLSFYSLGHQPVLRAHDQDVQLSAFVTVVARSAEAVLTDLLRISGDFGTYPFVRRFGQELSKLRKKRTPDTRCYNFESITDARTYSTGDTSGVTVSATVDLSYPGLTSYRGEYAFDHHALLCKGHVYLEYEDRRVEFDSEFPIDVCTQILVQVRKVMGQVSSGKSFDFSGRVCGVMWRVESRVGLWTVRWEKSDTEGFDVVVSGRSCLDGLLTVVEHLLTAMREHNPHLELNHRFTDRFQDLEELWTWFGEWSTSDRLNESVDQYMLEHGDLIPTHADAVPPDFPWEFEKVRALFPKKTWRYATQGLRFDRMQIVDGRLLCLRKEGLDCVDVRSGQVLWTHPTSEGEARVEILLAGPFVVVVDGQRSVELVRLSDGTPSKSSIEIRGDCLGVAHYAGADVVVVAGSLEGLRAVDVTTGRDVWAMDDNHGPLAHVLFHGPVVFVHYVGGLLQAQNPLTGDVLWRLRLNGRSEHPIRWHGEHLYVASEDPSGRSFSVRAILPLSGKTVWQMPVDGWLMDAPRCYGRWMILPVETSGRVYLVCMELSGLRPRLRWRLPLASAGIDRPTPLLYHRDGDQEYGLVRTDRGELTCVCMETGGLRWQRKATDDLLFRNLGLVVVRDAFVEVGGCVSFGLLSNGTEIYRSDLMLGQPEFLACYGQLFVLTGESAADETGDDQVICASLEHFIGTI
jgi:outer membrane protein assembly factor BamB